MKKAINDGKRGGTLHGKPHKNKQGKDVGGIKAVVTDAGNKPVELEGGEVIINKEASKKHWKLLSKINQSAGNGVPIERPTDPHDEDPSEEYERGGTIDFNVNHVPNKWIISYAKKIKEKHPEVWKLGGNIFGNEAFKNLSRVSERGYWLDSEEWMYKKWQSFLARHQHDFRIAGVIAVLKWGGKVNKGWAYMKNLIEAEIQKREGKKPKNKFEKGGNVVTYKQKFNKKYGFQLGESHSLAEVAKITKLKLSVLQDIYDKGIGAYKTNPQSVRPNVKSKEQWAMARVYSSLMGGKAAKVDANELQRGKKYADGGKVKTDCIEFIKKRETILINGYYVDLNTIFKIKEYADLGLPQNLDFILIGYNNGGQSNINSHQTIAGEGVRLLSEFLKITKQQSYIILDYYDKYSRRFDTLKIIDEIKNRHIVIVNRDTIDCSNYEPKFEDGGSVGFENTLFNELAQHNAPSFKDGGEVKLNTYKQRINANLEHMGTPTSEWSAVPISGFADTDADGKIVTMPQFSFPQGYAKAPTLFPNAQGGNMNCELCGRTPIKNAFYIQNDKKKFTLLVGSECVTHFGEGASGKQNLRQFKLNQAEILNNDFRKALDYVKENYSKQKSERLWNGGTRTFREWRATYITNDYDRFYKQNVSELFKDGQLDAFFNKKSRYKDYINWKEVYDSLKPFASDYYEKERTDKDVQFLSWYKRNKESGEAILEALILIEKATEGIILEFDSLQNVEEYEYGGELDKGIKAEMEHKDTIDRFKRAGVSDKQVATSIAQDHLDEDPNYYTKLDDMETKMAKGGLVVADKKNFYSYIADEQGVNSFQLMDNAKPIKLFDSINNVPIEGEYFSYKNKGNRLYNIIEATTGMAVVTDQKTLSEAKNYAESRIVGYNVNNSFQDLLQRSIDKKGLSPRYAVATVKPPKERKPRQPKPTVYQTQPIVQAQTNTDFNRAAFSIQTPTGEPSRLTYLQQILVRTKAFKEFFGDWETAAKHFLLNKSNWEKHYNNISKCLDLVTLEPKLVYHGTRVDNEFFEFDVTMQAGIGRPYAYFAHNIEYSENFTQSAQRPFSNSNPYLYSVFLRAKNPFIANTSKYLYTNKDADGWLNEIINTICWDLYKTEETNEQTQKIARAVKGQIESYIKRSIGQSSLPFWTLMARDLNGEFKAFLLSYKYDSIFYGEEIKYNYDASKPDEYTEAITIFNPNDIKLGDGRNLNFNPMKADIRLEKGGNLPVQNSEQKAENGLTKKEQLSNTLFGSKYEKGGNLEEKGNVFADKNIPPIEPNKNREFVDDLILKMKF